MDSAKKKELVEDTTSPELVYIEELILKYINEGYSEEDAILKALAEEE